MNKSPELKPTKYDALVAALVLLLALLCGMHLYLPHADGAKAVVVTVDGTEVERLPGEE